MDLKIVSTNPEAVMWPRKLWWRLGLCVPTETHQITDANAYQNYFHLLTQFTKAAIREKENGRHPRNVGKKGEMGKMKK